MPTTTLNPATLVLTFLVGFLTIMAVGFWLQRRGLLDSKKVRHRLRDLNDRSASSAEQTDGVGRWLLKAVPKLGDWSGRSTSQQHDDVKTRLLRAGYMHPNTVAYFMGVRVLIFLVVPLLGFGTGYFIDSRKPMLLVSTTVTGLCLAFLIPNMWLNAQVAKRQRQLLRAMPDALDMLVLCLEGGTTFQAALQRVSDELQIVHPILAMEMKIVLREMQLGLSAGDSLIKFANRCALEDVRELSLVIAQSDRFGASISKALRTHAETARAQRQQRAEEMAQKAAVKIIFPTLLCIFPAIFVVILGPVAYQSSQLFAR